MMPHVSSHVTIFVEWNYFEGSENYEKCLENWENCGVKELLENWESRHCACQRAFSVLKRAKNCWDGN